MAGRQVPQTGTVIGVSWATIRRPIQMPIALPNLNSSLGRFGWPSAENLKWTPLSAAFSLLGFQEDGAAEAPPSGT